MGAALFIVPERSIDGFDPFVSGEALGRSADVMDRLADEAGVRSLMEFFSVSSEDVRGFLGEDEGSEKLAGALFDADWFEARDGLASVRSLIRYLTDRPQAVGNAEELIEDLREFEVVLSRLAQEGVRWHLAVDA
jgi:hypothetical protein